jgi:hypothetical protein
VHSGNKTQHTVYLTLSVFISIDQTTYWFLKSLLCFRQSLRSKNRLPYVQTASFRPSICPSVTCYQRVNGLCDFHEIQYTVLYKKKSYQACLSFVKHRLSAILYLKESLNFYPRLPYFLTNLGDLSTEHHTMPLDKHEANQNRCSDRRTGRKWNVTRIFYILPPIWMKFATQCADSSLLGDSRLHKNRFSQRRTLLEAWYNFCPRSAAVGWSTALQAPRSRVRFPMVSLEFLINIILPTALWPWVST